MSYQVCCAECNPFPCHLLKSPVCMYHQFAIAMCLSSTLEHLHTADIFTLPTSRCCRVLLRFSAFNQSCHCSYVMSSCLCVVEVVWLCTIDHHVTVVKKILGFIYIYIWYLLYISDPWSGCTFQFRSSLKSCDRPRFPFSQLFFPLYMSLFPLHRSALLVSIGTG